MEKGRVKCTLCPKLCLIAEGKVGFCGARINESGKLYSLIYGKVSSIAVDPIEKKPLFHFHPGTLAYSLGTVGCNFRCKHCQNWQIAHAMAKDYMYGLIDLLPGQAVEDAVNKGASGIALTYNEPTIWMEYALDLFPLAKERDLYTVFVTNGYIMPEALDKIAPYLDAFRVDIKGFREESYREITGIYNWKTILEASERAYKVHNMHVEVVTNVVPGVNDSSEELRDIALWIKNSLSPRVPWHVTRFYPYLKYSDREPTPIKTLEQAREIGIEEGLEFVYSGNVPGHESESTYCPKCERRVVHRMGYDILNYHVERGCCSYCGKELYIRENK